jgi:hypothetical protein
MNSMSVNSPYAARYAGSANYRNGTMGYGTTDFNVIFSNWGSGFIDSWSSPGNAPGGSSHYVGHQVCHYNHQNSTNVYGYQMACAGEAVNRFFWRSSWATPNAWVEMIHSGNIGSQSVATAGNITAYTINQSVGSDNSPSFHTVPTYYLRNRYDITTDHPYGIYFGTSVSDYSYAIYKQTGAWSHPYPDLHIAFHTGIKLGAHYSYNGIRFYNNSDFATITASIGDGDNHMRGYYDIIAYASDKRLKHNIQRIENALSKVNSLTGMTYQWNNVGSQHGWSPDMETREAGVFAQDVQAVLPEAVKLAPFDNNMGVSKSGENFLTVKYEKIVPLLIEAIKELKAEIDELKSQK